MGWRSHLFDNQFENEELWWTEKYPTRLPLPFANSSQRATISLLELKWLQDWKGYDTPRLKNGYCSHLVGGRFLRWDQLSTIPHYASFWATGWSRWPPHLSFSILIWFSEFGFISMNPTGWIHLSHHSFDINGNIRPKQHSLTCISTYTTPLSSPLPVTWCISVTKPEYFSEAR